MSAATTPLIVDADRKPHLSARVLKLARQVHLYLGVFCAPALLFFAFTGLLQTFSMHENNRATGYKAPQWIAMAAQIHKKQTYQLRTPPVQAAAPKPTLPAAPLGLHAAEPSQAHAFPEKIFFAIVGWSFIFSVLTGVYMAYRYDRNAWLVSGLLLAGVVAPVVLLFV